MIRQAYVLARQASRLGPAARLGGVAGLVLLFVVPAAAEDWPQFRGPTGQGISSAKNLPVRWNDKENVAWKVAVPGKGWSSPIIYGKRIYVTTAVPIGSGEGADQSLRALALEAASGAVVWDIEVFRQSGTAPGGVHPKNSHASATPFTDGRYLFVHFGTHGTACLNLDGEVIWRNRELRYEPVHGNGGSPALVGDVLVVSCDGAQRQFVVALDRRTGRVRWQKPRPPSTGKRFAFSTPTLVEIAGRTQIVSAGANWVVSYDPRNGEENWRVGYNGYSVVPRPVFGHGLLFVCTGYDSSSLLAIRPDGSGDVTGTHVTWSARRSIPYNPSLLLVGEELYMVEDRGVASCLDATSGKVHWHERLPGNFSASPVYGDGKVYLQSEEGHGIVLRAGTTFQPLGHNVLGEQTLASYAVSEGALIIRSQEHLYRIGR